MKFRKFPILVQEGIIKNMNYATVFSMSLCSTKTANAMKLVSFNKPAVLVFVLKKNECTVFIKNKDPTVEGIVTMYRGETNQRTPIEVKFGNMKQIFEFHLVRTEYLQMRYDYNLNKPVENTMIQHIHKLFGETLPIRLVIKEQNIFHNTPLYEKVIEVSVECAVTAQIIDYIHEHPDVHFLYLLGELDVAPEVSQITFVFITKAKEFTRTILQNFNARSLSLKNAVCDNGDILEFINKWQNNNGYQSIVYVSILSEVPLFDRDALLAQIETTQWDETTRPGIYKHRYPSHHQGPAYETDTKAFRDIRRADGKLASFEVIANVFVFCVWE